jgi:hypothetical protein
MTTPKLADLVWLSGSWVGGEGVSETEEHWTRPAGGSMLGMGRTVADGRTTQVEQMVLEARPTGVFYIVRVNDQPRVEFRLVRSDAQEAVFENLGHNFPQRIIYQRQDHVLTARIEDASGSRQMAWSWRRRSDG